RAQAEAGAASLGREVWIEDVREIPGLDSGAMIGDDDVDPVASAASVQRHTTRIALHGVTRVDQHVDQRDAEPLWIGRQRLDVLIEIEIDVGAGSGDL